MNTLKVNNWKMAGLALLLMMGFVAGLNHWPRKVHNHQQNLYRNFEIGLKEYSIIPMNGNQVEIEMQDRTICHGSTKPEDVCTAVIWRLTKDGKFISREEYKYRDGLKVSVGRIDSVGTTDDYRQIATYGIGNQIPYVIQTYSPTTSPRLVQIFQERLNTFLKDIPPAG